MKSRRSPLRFRSVLLPPDGGGEVGKLAVRQQFYYSIVGMVVGILFLLGGILLLLNGILGSSHFIASVAGGKLDISDAPPGIILAALGVLIIWFTSYTVQLREN